MKEMICPLSLMNNKDGQVLECFGKDCMFWETRVHPNTCALKSALYWYNYSKYIQMEEFSDNQEIVDRDESTGYG